MCFLYLLCLNTSVKDCITVLCKKRITMLKKHFKLQCLDLKSKEWINAVFVINSYGSIAAPVWKHSQCCFCTTYTDCLRTANCEPGEPLTNLKDSSRNQACAVCKLLCTILRTKMQCVIKHLRDINIYFWKMSKKCPPSTPKIKIPLSQESPMREIHFQKWNSGPE